MRPLSRPLSRPRRRKRPCKRRCPLKPQLGAISFLGVALVFSGCFAWAEQPTVKLSSSLGSESGNAGLTTTDSASAVTKISSVDVNSGTLMGSAILRTGVDVVSPDYSRNLVTDYHGNSHPLSGDYSHLESRLRAGLDFYRGPISFNVDGSETLNSTPYPGSSAKLVTSYEDHVNGSRYAIGLSRMDYSAGPASYYINPDTLTTQQRPARNLDDRLSASYQQILAERLKSKIEIFSGEKPDSRPPYRGGEISLAFALGDESALIGKTGGAHEDRNSALYDDRGYFDALWSQLEYRLEPNYHWSLSATVGSILEMETARGTLASQQVGTDSIGLSALTRGRSWELGIKALASFSNTGYQSALITGDFTWQI